MGRTVAFGSERENTREILATVKRHPPIIQVLAAVAQTDSHYPTRIYPRALRRTSQNGVIGKLPA